jgi:hypothetical protein
MRHANQTTARKDGIRRGGEGEGEEESGRRKEERE